MAQADLYCRWRVWFIVMRCSDQIRLMITLELKISNTLIDGADHQHPINGDKTIIILFHKCFNFSVNKQTSSMSKNVLIVAMI